MDGVAENDISRYQCCLFLVLFVEIMYMYLIYDNMKALGYFRNHCLLRIFTLFFLLVTSLGNLENFVLIRLSDLNIRYTALANQKNR